MAVVQVNLCTTDCLLNVHDRAVWHVCQQGAKVFDGSEQLASSVYSTSDVGSEDAFLHGHKFAHV